MKTNIEIKYTRRKSTAMEAAVILCMNSTFDKQVHNVSLQFHSSSSDCWPSVSETICADTSRSANTAHTAAAGVCSVFCRASYNLMTPAHKLLSVLQQNCMSELNKSKAPRSRIGPNRSIAPCAPPRHTSVWAGSMKWGVLIRAGGVVCFPRCSSFRHHYHSSHHQAPWLLDRCEAQQTWLNLAVCILQCHASHAIKGSWAAIV